MNFTIALTFLLISSTFLLAKDKPNVLFLLVDDLKPSLGCYGDKLAITPNLDKLAARGMRFELAYCNQAVCAASRTALLLGSRPTSTGIHGLSTFHRKAIPDAITMLQHFMAHGYRTEGIGKIFHTGHGNQDDTVSWSVPWKHEPVIEYLLPASSAGGNLTKEAAMFGNHKADIASLPHGNAMEFTDLPDQAHSDGRIAIQGIERLQAAAKRPKPFFLALGFVRPHLPFTAPKKYLDLHDKAKFKLAEFITAPKDAPAVAHKRGGEITNYEPVPKNGSMPDDLARDLIHGYYASVTFADAQIGLVLDELDKLNMSANTIVVLWGDHGWHLGDHGYWTKHTNYEQANRIPIIISAPTVTKSGSSSKHLVESVDLYPTLAELAGLPAPEGPQPIDGISLVPLLHDPDKILRSYAYHCYPRGKVMGRAIRTQRYRLVEWKIPGAESSTAQLELYDYQTDPLETQNLAATETETVNELMSILAEQPEALSNSRGN